MFTITKQFTTGTLKGITINDKSPVAFEVGKEYKTITGGSDYIVLACIVS